MELRLPSLRARLLLMVVALLAPAFLAAGLILYVGYLHDREKVEKHLLETARALSLVVDRQFGQAEALLWSLAASPQLQARDYKAFDAFARKAIRLPDAWVLVEEPGRQVVNTRLPPGAILPNLSTQTHWNGHAPGQARVSNLFIGLVTKAPAVALDSLVVSPDGTPQYLSVLMPADAVSHILSDQGLPAPWTGAILDRNGTVVARSHNPDTVVGKPATESTVQRVQAGTTQGVFEGISLDGTPTVMALSRSPSSGWSTLVAVPQSEVTAGARDLALALAGTGSILLALGAALAFHLARRITRPVETLVSEVQAMQSGTFGPSDLLAPEWEFRETAALRRAFDETRQILRQRETERDRAHDSLRTTNESLELRVEERTQELEQANASLRQSQSALAEREALYAGVFRFSTDGLLVLRFDPSGNIAVEACNPVIEHLLGKTAAETTGKPLREVLPAGQWHVLGSKVGECLTAGHPIVYEQEHTFPGRKGTWMVTLVPIREDKMPVTRVLSSLRDVTHERSVEAELRRSRDRYSTLFERSPFNLAVIGVYPNDRFVYEDANPPLLESLGFARDQFVGLTPEEIFLPETAAYVKSHYRTCVATKSSMDFEVTGKVPVGEVTRRTVLVPLLDPDGHVAKIFLTSIDLTEQRRMEERLRQAHRLESVGQLTGGIAHDFNNLLTVVMGNLDLLKRAKPERVPLLIENALSAVEHGRRLTAQLLAFSRRQPLKPEIVDLGTMIGGMRDMLGQSLRDDIVVDIDLPQGLWPVEVDVAQLQAALINLAANARDAMPKGGRFTLSARNTVSQSIGTVETVSIEVSDTGTGIPPEALQRVFEPFYTTKPVGHGTGLGLAQVYGFVQQSGGTIDIKSEVGRGTTVTLTLERARGSRQDQNPIEETNPSGSHATLRVLLVEDNAQVAQLAMALLHEQGHGVVHCGSAPDALRVLDQDSAFDVVFSDLVMPGGMDGLDFARVIRERWPAMPILLATGYSESVERAVKEGFPILKKPYHPSELHRALKAVIAQPEFGSNVLPLRPRQA